MKMLSSYLNMVPQDVKTHGRGEDLRCGVHVIKLDLIMIKVYYLLKYNRKCTQ